MTSLLLDSYETVGGINHIDGVNLPNKKAVASCLEHFLQLIFPGYYTDQCLRAHGLAHTVLEHLQSLRDGLKREVVKNLEYAPPAGGVVESSEASATRLVDEVLEQLPHLRELLRGDVEAAYDGDPAATSFEEIILAYPGLEAIAVQRLAHLLYQKGVGLVARMMTEWAHSRTGIDIHPGASIGTHFFIDHGTGVVVGETTQIGNFVKIYHGVTLGAKSTSGGQQLRGVKRHPTIEDEVTIYPGVTILGGDTVIGARSTIGGNVFLLQSVPPDTLVLNEEYSIVLKPKRKVRS